MDINVDNAKEVARIAAEFIKPFPENEIKLKPAKVSGARCLALAYIDSRLVMDRLDEVVGVNNWEDRYTVLPGGTEVQCELRVRIAGEWVTKTDVGGESEQPDGGDRMKAAHSDAFKRAAVKFGIGRFLYRRPQQWMDYDPVKKQIVRPEAPKQPAKVQLRSRDWMQDIVRRVKACASVQDGVPIWKEVDAEKNRGAVPVDFLPLIDAEFTALKKRFPEAAKA